MSSATTTALIVAGVASAGASAAGTIYAANKSSSTAKDVAATQQQASDKATQASIDAQNAATAAQAKATQDALEFEKQVYAQKQQQVSPYIGYGQGALSALGRGLGVTPVAQTPITFPAAQQTGGLPQTITGGNFSPTGSHSGAPNPSGSSASTQGPAVSDTGLVSMKAPDGTVEDVPQEFVQHYLQQGAQLVTSSSYGAR